MTALDAAREARARFDNAEMPWDDAPVILRNALEALIAEHETVVREMHQRELHHFETEQLLTTSFIINAAATRVPDGRELVPRFTGPFPSAEAAHEFMNAREVYGTWSVRELTAPEDWPAP